MDEAISGTIGASRRSADSRSRWVRRLLVTIGVVAVGLIAWLAWQQDWIGKWKETASPLPFFTGMAIAPAFGIPITPLFVLAGATFGRGVGILGSALALAANLALCYWIARSGLRRSLIRLLRRFGYELPSFTEKREGSLRFTLVVKATPGIPQFIKSYGLGVAGVPFAVYMVSSMIISGAYGVALIVLGESLFRHESVRSALVAGAVVVLALGICWWRRRARVSAE